MLPIPVGERGPGDRLIQDGDLVIVYESYKAMKAVTVTKNGEFQNRYGLFMHNNWIGKPFGCKVSSKKGGFVHLLAPTPQLWTLVLTHRTQILYIADISFVLAYLEVRPGCVVLESGTGSGSLTTALARSVAPSGHIYSFDFHEQRAEAARKDLERNGLNGLVTVTVRDIQGEGFPPEYAGEVDAIFLDLPQPWTAIPSAVKLLRGDAPLCSFSPCIEQVQKTCEALTTSEFRDLRTFEVLLRTYEVHEEFFGTSFGSGVAGSSPVTSPPYKRVCATEDKRANYNVEKSSLNMSMKLSIDDTEETNQSTLDPKNTMDLEVSVRGNVAKSRLKKGRSRGGDPLASKFSIVARAEPETKGHTGVTGLHKGDQVMADNVVHKGGCHCKHVRWQVKAPSKVVCWNCNCSNCKMRQNLHFIVPSKDFELEEGAQNWLSLYTFGTHQAKHLFCKVCGICSYYIPRSNPDGIAVTIHCIDSGTVENVEVRDFDGQNWESSFEESSISTWSKS